MKEFQNLPQPRLAALQQNIQLHHYQSYFPVKTIVLDPTGIIFCASA